MDPSVEKALVDVVDTASLQGKAVLVGGQAMADWYAWLHHCGVIPADMGPLATPRPTTDIDVFLDVRRNSPQATDLATELAQNWEPDPAQTFRYSWKEEGSVTLDLVCGSGPAGAGKVHQLRIGRGSYLFRARVIPETLLHARLVTRCQRPALASRDIARLDHAGLTGSKFGAVASVVAHLALADEAGTEPEDWVKRLDKDLQDLDRLLAAPWIDRACRWEFHVDEAKAVKALSDLAQAVVDLPTTQGVTGDGALKRAPRL